jgi:L-ascorbate metabolism protein UlaG (beta-lactamase superfamily)
MLSAVGAMPGFKVFGGGRRANPLVALPAEAEAALASVTGVLVTHEHPDHFDRPGLRWVVERALPVWTNGVDAPNLARKGLDVRTLRDGALGMAVETIPSRHGRGVLGWLMGPVSGYFLAHPGEPSVYLTGDSVHTDGVLEAIDRLRPDVVVAPAGAANLGRGGDILFSLDELLELAARTRDAGGAVVLNHLEALDHCPTTRDELRARVADAGLAECVHIPADGEELTFAKAAEAPHAPAHAPRGGWASRPGCRNG